MASPSNLQHLSLRLFAFILGLIGITLVIGGAWLISLGGSWYYLPAGLLLLASAVQFWRARISGFLALCRGIWPNPYLGDMGGWI